MMSVRARVRIKHVVRLVAFSLLALVQPVAGQDRPQLRAVVVHGELLDGPMYFHEPDIIASCLWAATYNLHGRQTGTPPGRDAPTITFSFVLEAEWERYVDSHGEEPFDLSPDTARFHTRIWLTPTDGGTPTAARRRAPGMGPFEAAHPLDPMAENFLARLGIPTRLEADGSVTENFGTTFNPGDYRAWRECLAIPDAGDQRSNKRLALTVN